MRISNLFRSRRKRRGGQPKRSLRSVTFGTVKSQRRFKRLSYAQ